MKMKYLAYALGAILFSGCASTSQGTDPFNRAEWKTKSYETKIKPYIGTRQNDAKVVMDMGRVLKVWVAPYTQSRTLIAAHDIYAIVQKPKFILGEMVPSGKRTGGLTTCNKDFPFVFKDRHIESIKTGDRFKSGTIKKYVNNVYKAQNNPSHYDKKRKSANKRYDKTIADYIK